MNSDWWKYAFGEDYFQFSDELIPQKRTKNEVLFAIKTLGLRKGMKVLDAPSGYGRHAYFLSKKGINVIGIDYSSFLLAQAKKKCRSCNIHFKKLDLRKLSYKDEFDAIVSFFTSFGYFSDRDNEKVLKNYYRALRQNGRLLLDLPNTLNIIKKIPIKECFNIAEGYLCDEILTISASHMTAKTKFTINKGSECKEIKGKLRLYTFPEIKKVLIKIGFRNIRVFGNFSHAIYKFSSSNMIIVAEKK